MSCGHTKWYVHKYFLQEYRDGAQKFVDDAVLRKKSDMISCPCRDCQNLCHRKSSIVFEHLVIKGMDKSYTTWVLHGEDIKSEKSGNKLSETFDLCRTLYEQDQCQGQDERDLGSNKDTKDEEFIKKLNDAERPLYPGCKEHTRLSSTVLLYKIKVKFGLSNICFTKILEAVHDLLPAENTLPDSKYAAEKLIKDFQLEDKEIQACVNDCCLFRKDLENCETCPKCKFSRWKVDEHSKKIRKGVPAKVLRYFPIIPTFKRMFGSLEIARHLRWHSDNKSNDGNMRHPVDSEAWEQINIKWPSFGDEPRNLRLGLSADGINPYRQLSSRHSCWPVMLVIYNLPPWLFMKDKHIMLALLIPGPKQPGNDIHIYLQPLIDDLLELWDQGVKVYDAVEKSPFTLKAILMWTASDLLAYGNLAGCTTKGKTACPICGNSTMSQWLPDFKKTVYLCNSCFLEANHPFRIKKSWFDGNIEDRERPIPLTGSEILEVVQKIENFAVKSARFKSMREKQDLPYTGSRMGYARMEEKLKKESDDPNSITRVTVWCAGHTKVNGEASNGNVANCLDKIEEFNASSSNSNFGSIKKDALAHVLGPDRRGPPRGVGFGVTSARLEASTRRNAKIALLEERVETMMENMERMNNIITSQKSLIDSLNSKLMEYEHHDYYPNNPGYDASTFTSQAQDNNGDTRRAQQGKFTRQESETSNWKENRNCKLIDWLKGYEVVATGRWVTSDPDSLLHCKPLGKNSSKVWVVKAEKPFAPLWKSPNSEINTMREAEGTTIAWPTDHILMEEPIIL